jgi:LysM repeat protein
MSETAPEAPAGGGGGIGGTLTRKVGPLPVWGWLAVLTVLAVGYWLIKGKGSAAAPSSAGTDTGTTPAGDVPDYVSQTTVNVTNPAEPSQPSTIQTEIPGAPATPAAPAPAKTTTPAKATAPAPVKSAQPPVMSGTYTVKAGDTLNSLAAKFGITRVVLAHANGLGTGAGLKTGQVLHVPGPVVPISKGGKGLWTTATGSR